MTWNPTTCPICGNDKPAVWDLCLSCLQEHGDRSEWPDWVAFVVEDERRLRYQHNRALRLEFEVPPEIMDEYDRLGVADQMMTRPLSEMAWSQSSARMLIPRDPYDDELSNQQYRRANGVIEEE